MRIENNKKALRIEELMLKKYGAEKFDTGYDLVVQWVASFLVGSKSERVRRFA